ncbi:apolipoprotein N-acyltransferase [Microterricola pindariensis]|uniref:Apolipoprotein N-acyltransferase n=2 Tax=Microterricola pindariensis TaxID=478010 RepID=A0ABX5AV33_9MICO|nr:apolipoprotein N-acyltransferase [Microterricola pindariensis]PPL16930.1 apolipoprotein N-acyltransferase [Microterricola pindariensis]
MEKGVEGHSALRLPIYLAVPLAAASGIILDGAFPDRGWWPLAPLAVALLFLTLLGRGPWVGWLLGLIAGLTFWLTHIHWLTLYLGALPWLALAVLQSLFFSIGVALIAVVLRWGPRLWPTPLGRLGMVPVVVAGLWTAREAISAVWPYGGFAWGRLALSQTEGPFAGLLSLVGASGLSFLMALLAALLVQLAREQALELGWRAAIAVATVALLLAVPAWPTLQTGTTRLAAVQGNSNAGLFAEYVPGEILNNHVAETLPLVGEDVDMVVWPENGSDIDPLRSPQAAKTLDYVSTQMRAPLIVGTITLRDDEYFNSSLLWKAGEGAVQIYDKVHPVPFAEYMPDREFWRPFAPDLIDLIGRDYSIGTQPNVFDVNGILAGIAICFDIADDQLVKEMITGGAQIILAQTNNADFGSAAHYTDESAQQLAIARMRAIEAGRTVVNISTVSSSAIILPDGSTLASIPDFTAGSMLETVPLSDTVTPAMAAGRGIEWLVSGLGLAGLALAVTFAARSRRTAGRGPRG